MTVYNLYDAAGAKTEIAEPDRDGLPNMIHTFTFDDLERPLNSDYYGSCPTGTPHPEIERTYDALPVGSTCPMTGGCNNLKGRLAIIKATLICSSTYTDDGALDQTTYYSYDAAGRIVEEYITDDSGRVADQKYTWTKDGALSQITTPSTAVIG